MKDIDPFHVIPIKSIAGGSREILLILALRSNKMVIDLQEGRDLIASEEFSDATVWTAVRFLVNLKRLRRGEAGTLPELARFMRHDAHGDALLFHRLAIDFDIPTDHLIVTAWRSSGHWPAVDEFSRTLDALPERSREYVVTRAYHAAKHGEIKDKALADLVKSLRQKHQPQPQPTEDNPPVVKKRRLLRRSRRE